MSFGTVYRSLALIGVLAAGAGATEVHFGPTAMAGSETARLNAYCDGSVAPAPCQITFEFRSPDGRILLQQTVSVQPGTSAFLDLPGAKAGLGRGPGQIDPCWDIAFGAALASLEIFDTGNQRTRLLINWGDRSLPRTGDIDFSPAGFTRNQTARLGAFCPDDQRTACDVTFEFHDAAGNILKQSRARLLPGTSGFLDLSPSDTASRDSRITLDPCVKVADGAAVATLGIIDEGGQPGVQAYPGTLAIAERQ